MTDFITKIMDNYECGADTDPFIRKILTQLELNVFNKQSQNMFNLLIRSNCNNANENDNVIDQSSAGYNQYLHQINDLKQAENVAMTTALKLQASIINE